MKLKIFSVFDSPAEAYLPPFYMPTTAMAHRAFRQSLDDEKHQFSKTPRDYTLFHIGEFDDANAEIVTQIPKALANGLEVISADES